MVLQNEHYSINASTETMPTLSQYDIVYNLNGTNTDEYYMARIFNISRNNGPSISIALVDFLCAGYKPFGVLEDDYLTVILFDSIVRLDLITGTIITYTECDNMGGLHEIHAIEDGYIIWGEGDIFRYDLELNRIWHFMGRDILVSLKMNQHFWIEDNRIHCRDFEGWHYILDLNGKLLEDFKEIEDE